MARGTIVAFVAALGAGWGAAAQQTDPIDAVLLSQYVLAQEALAADDLDAARQALERLVLRADADLAPLARAAAGADDLVALRRAFKPLSERLVQLRLPSEFVVAYCPMFDGNAGASWIQKSGEITNPYFGAAMLRCGSIDQSPGSHMDHSPRYGGVFFMAPDAWHHLEGTYPEVGVFRVRLFDNFTQLLDARPFEGRAVIEEVYDSATRRYRELEAYPLRPSPDGRYLEALVGELEMPAEIAAKLRLSPDGPEERFDFVFVEYSDEIPRVTDAAEIAPTGGIRLFARDASGVPSAPRDIAFEIGVRDQEIAQMLQQGQTTEIFIPALESKELALALEDHRDAWPDSHRDELRLAIKTIVRTAWLLDQWGDLGNRPRVQETYALFQPAVATIKAAYGIP